MTCALNSLRTRCSLNWKQDKNENCQSQNSGLCVQVRGYGDKKFISVFKMNLILNSTFLRIIARVILLFSQFILVILIKLWLWRLSHCNTLSGLKYVFIFSFPFLILHIHYYYMKTVSLVIKSNSQLVFYIMLIIINFKYLKIAYVHSHKSYFIFIFHIFKQTLFSYRCFI